MMYSSYTKRLATAIRSMPSQLSRWVGNSNMKIHSDDAPLVMWMCMGGVHECISHSDYRNNLLGHIFLCAVPE